MKTKLLEGLKLAVALAVVAGLAWVAYGVLALVMRWLASVQSELATAIVAAAAAVLASFITVGVGKYLERRDSLERELRLRKIPVYEQLIDSIFTFFQQGKPGYPKAGQAVPIREQTQLIQNVILWGSDRVLNRCCSVGARECL